MKLVVFVIPLFVTINLYSQADSTNIKTLKFTGDFRFRVEHDWNSHNSSGIKRSDRSRLRYRFRFGLNYILDKNSSFGGRVRSGNIDDQQGPHVTLGGGNGEFGLVRIGFEKLFYRFEHKKFIGWIGKNDLLLKKENELFWNDNVFPEGIGLRVQDLIPQSQIINSLQINAGHYIIKSGNQTFDQDCYLQVLQIASGFFDNKWSIWPGFYHFNKIGNFPDGQQSFFLDYSIFHIGSTIQIGRKQNIKLSIEYYSNLENYNQMDSIPFDLRDQKNGWVLSAKYGRVQKKGDWLVHLYYAHLGKFSIVDYFAQNDWARWDYSSVNAFGSRLSNFQGVEIRLGYAFKEKFNLILRTYFVEQLVREGDFKEDGSRIRLDMNIGF